VKKQTDTSGHAEPGQTSITTRDPRWIDALSGAFTEVDPIVWTKFRQSLDGAAG